MKCTSDDKLEHLCKWVERAASSLPRVLTALEKLIVAILVFVVFLIGAIKVVTAIEANGPTKSESKIESRQSGVKDNKAMIGNVPVEPEDKIEYPHEGANRIKI